MRRAALTLSNTTLIDHGTRNVPAMLFDEIDAGRSYRIGANGRHVDLVGTLRIGGGFGVDGYLVIPDQIFLKLFRTRAPGAPNLLLVRGEPGTGSGRARRPAAGRAARARHRRAHHPGGGGQGLGLPDQAEAGRRRHRHQVLATDVADHLKEYATFKAIGYRQSFFLIIVFEETLILAPLGFVPGSAVSLGIYALVERFTGLPIGRSFGRLVFVLLGTFGMCMLSGAIATRRLARAEPAELC